MSTLFNNLAGTLTGALVGIGGSAVSALTGIGGVVGLGTLGNAYAAESEAEIAGDMMTAMALSPAVHQANRAKMYMDAMSGIAQSYMNGAANLQNASFAINNKLGEVFAKAGGH